MLTPRISVFSTSPQSSKYDPVTFPAVIAQVAQWSEKYGCTGSLVYTDNSLVDAWLTSQIMIHNTSRLRPLVAVQPVYMHPYTVAKMVSSLAFLYGRRVCLNMVAGGFKNDLVALNDTTPHDKRYERLTECTTLIRRLLTTATEINYDGDFYKVHNLRLTPPLPKDLEPEIFFSGSSEAGLVAARTVGATAIMYPRPASEYEQAPLPCDIPYGIRVGIITRADEDGAWAVARQRFPADRRGQLTQQLAMKTSDSVWHKQLSELAETSRHGGSPYWLWPFENYKTFCPYLVGSYKTVAEEIGRYVDVGYRVFILDIPATEEELFHTSLVFRQLSNLTRPPRIPSVNVAQEKRHRTALLAN
jgi:alkanesulfonate monooxygenase